MQNGFELIKDDFNPTFLFTWRGIRKENEKYYHNHDFIEIAIILSGQGQYRIDDKIYDVKEGDVVEIAFGEKRLKIKVLDVREVIRKNDASELYEVLPE